MFSWLKGPCVQDVCSSFSLITFSLPFICNTFNVDNVWSIISHRSFIKCSPRSLTLLSPFGRNNKKKLTLLTEHHYTVTQHYGRITVIKHNEPLTRSTNGNMAHELKITVKKNIYHRNQSNLSITFAVKESRGINVTENIIGNSQDRINNFHRLSFGSGSKPQVGHLPKVKHPWNRLMLFRGLFGHLEPQHGNNYEKLRN